MSKVYQNLLRFGHGAASDIVCAIKSGKVKKALDRNGRSNPRLGEEPLETIVDDEKAFLMLQNVSEFLPTINEIIKASGSNPLLKVVYGRNPRSPFV